jgi:hypothetical protein
MLTLPYLELPITHVCNLHCDDCFYDAYYGNKIMASADEIHVSAAAWSKRIKPKMIKILGGEPLANRELPRIFLTSANVSGKPPPGRHQRLAAGKLTDAAVPADGLAHHSVIVDPSH